MIRIFVDYDGIVIPVPVANVIVVKRGNAKVEIIEEEPFAISSAKMEHMPAPKAPGKAAMFPWVIKMKARIVAPLIMSHPLIIVMNVRRLGMIGLVAERSVIPLCPRFRGSSFRRAILLWMTLRCAVFLRMRCAMRRRWTMRWDVAATNVSRAAAMLLLRRLLFVALRERVMAVEQG
jgi:hypothetical protein